MTIEEILEIKDPAILEGITDKEYEEIHLAQYLKWTRPESPDAIHKEKGVKIGKKSEAQLMLEGLSPEKRKALEDMAKAQGLDLEDLL